jgi:phage terminase large subunit-like protein
MTAWTLACPDWEERLRAGRPLVPDLPLFAESAEQAVNAFNMLRLPDVKGSPTMQRAAGEWFRAIVRALFGSLDPASGQRLIREVFLLVPKKNSKTTNGALLMVVALLVNQRPNASFLLIAPTQKIADLAFDQAAGAIALDSYLSNKVFHIQTHLKRITHKRTGATLEVKSFDPKIVTGTKPSGILIDELHVVASAPEADRVIRQLRGGLISQPEGFMMTITTQSERPPAGVFAAELNKARAVRDGRLEEAILPVLYEFPEALGVCEVQPDGLFPWENPEHWRMVTPNAGRSITVDRLMPDYRAAKAEGPEALRGWASQHLNIEIGLALRADAWVGGRYWERNGDKALTLRSLIDRSDVIVAGIDGGGLDDLYGLTLLGRDTVSGEWLAWSHAWAHEIVLERRKDIVAQLRDFEADGDLTIVSRPGDDVAQAADIIMEAEAAGLLAHKHAIGVDVYGIGATVAEIRARGIHEDRIVGIGQGWKMSGAIKTTERRLAGRTLVHTGSRLMAWSIRNAKVEPKGNAVSITKAASGNAKIDPLMSLFNAVSLMATNPEAVAVAPWEDPEFRMAV